MTPPRSAVMDNRRSRVFGITSTTVLHIMIFAAALQLLGVGLVLAGAPLTGSLCLLFALLLVVCDRFHHYPHSPPGEQ